MKNLIVLTFLLLAVATLTSSNPARPVHGVTPHAQQRLEGRAIDGNAAKRAISIGRAWKVESVTRNGTKRDIYEGSYDDSYGTNYFRLVYGTDTNVIITAIRLNYAPQRPRY